MSQELFSQSISKLPQPHQDIVITYLEAILADNESVFTTQINRAVQENLFDQLIKTVIASEYIKKITLNDPTLLTELLTTQRLWQTYTKKTYAQSLETLLSEASSEEELQHILRRFKHQEMIRIIWRDVNQLAPLNETLMDLSLLADACITHALSFLYQKYTSLFGTPLCSNGQPQQLLVLALGKLGGYELNVSSDIDLVFTFAEPGKTKGQRSIENEVFFTKLSQALIKALEDRTPNGYVYRVDTRLRPYGSSGPIVMSLPAMELYYQSQGREWERYALIKARILSGTAEEKKLTENIIYPFVYRRYLDFNVIQALRDIKQQIQNDVKSKSLESNIKKGPGGIREIEFIGQSFQLIYGGKNTQLRETGIQLVLSILKDQNYLPEHIVAELTTAYQFLRTLENRLQAYADHQTHTLPTEHTQQQRIAYTLGFADWTALTAKLDEIRDIVEQHFMSIAASPHLDQHDVSNTDDTTSITLTWLCTNNDAHNTLLKMGFTDAEHVLKLLTQFQSSLRYRKLSNKAQMLLEHIIPITLHHLAKCTDTELLNQLLNFYTVIGGRTTYLSLLVEHPIALSQLVKLCRRSDWIIKELNQTPLLLDELLDARQLYSPQKYHSLDHELGTQLKQLPAHDLEQHMETLRQFKKSQVFRVAAADLMDKIPLMRVSDYLSDIATVVAKHVLEFVWHELSHRYGPPEGLQPNEMGVAIIGYGKLGGLELSYTSDLDLVFICNEAHLKGKTTGANAIDAGVFYQRLVQRFLHVCHTRTPSGILYEIDTRLRPSGASGLAITTLNAFQQYQTQKAETWEHQALVRARYLAGDIALGDAFENIKHQTLCIHRNCNELKQAIVAMRHKISQAKPAKDLKTIPGGITDIEFIVQYGVLAWSCQYPDLTCFTDNIRLLNMFELKKLISKQDSQILQSAYQAYRSQIHRESLNKPTPNEKKMDIFSSERSKVLSIWSKILTKAD